MTVRKEMFESIRWVGRIIAGVFMREEREKNYVELEAIVDENKEKPVIIVGNFNARTGSEGGIGIDEEREVVLKRSEDDKKNDEEKEMLIWLRECG